MKIKKIILPSICLVLLTTIFYSGYEIFKLLNSDTSLVPTEPYVTKEVMNNVQPTIQIDNKILKPFVSEEVEPTIPYYKTDGTDQEQQNALIYYENIYMENTGIMYTSNNPFDVIASLEGVVKNVKKDDLMGNIVEIETKPNIMLVYQGIDEVKVNVGDSVNQGEIIGLSAKNSIVGDSKYSMHFEVYFKGQIINPDDFYNMKPEDLSV